jgi:hypothetical protein
VALTALLEFVADVAVIVQGPAVTGAVNSPVVLIDPHEVVHFTDAFAVNCVVPIAVTETVVGVTVSCPAVTTEPESATVCGLPVPASTKFNVAVRVPDAVGLNTTDAVQLADAATLAPQVLVEMLKSPAFVPVMVTLETVTAAEVPLVNVADCEALPVPIAVEVNVKLEGLAVTLPVPVLPGANPERATDCGLLVAESVKTRVADSVPEATGA